MLPLARRCRLRRPTPPHPRPTAASRRFTAAAAVATPQVRKVQVTVEEVHSEMGKQLETPVYKVAATAAIRNPYAGGRHVEDLSPMFELGAAVGDLLATRAAKALHEASGLSAEAYGKGCIVGTDGELEHSGAILHPQFGAPVRAAVGGGAAIIPGTKKVGGPGSSITVPITNKDNIFFFPHMDAIDVRLGDDAPRYSQPSPPAPSSPTHHRPESASRP